jgi:hypothetical protein
MPSLNRWISIGIDPGLDGAVVAIDNNYQLLGCWDTIFIQAKKRLYATAVMGDLLRELVEGNPRSKLVKAWLEKAAPRSQEGVSSAFKNGQGFGLWEGILVGLGITYDIVAPNNWTRVMLKDVPVGDPKARSMAKCQRLFPSIELKKPRGRKLTLDGRADASLIAYYGMMQMHGERKAPVTHAKKPPRLRSSHVTER